MSQQKIEIRQALKAHLSTGTQAEDRVFVSRTVPLQMSQIYPVILIYGGAETSQRSTQSKLTLREYSLTIEIRVKESWDEESSDGVDDALDTIGKEVEARLDLFKNSIVKDTVYQGSTPEMNGEGEESFGSLSMNYQFKYIR